MSQEPPRWRRILQASLPWLLVLAVFASGALTGWYAWSVHHFGSEGFQKTRIFYDQYHVVRHPIGGKNVPGAWGYHEVSGYNEFYRTLRREGLDVHVHRRGMGRLKPGMLDDFDVFFIGEQSMVAPYETKAMTPEERRVLFDWVREGGGLWATVEHTNAYGMADWFNPWMEGTGIQARYDSTCEPNGTELSRDWVVLTPIEHPATEGVHRILTCNGCSLDTEHGLAFTSPDSWSDQWNPGGDSAFNGDNERSPDELGGPLAGLAAVEYGQGRIIATCDHNLLSNPTLYSADHYRFLLQAMSWLSGGGEHTDPDLYRAPALALLTLVLAILASLRRWPVAVIAVAAGLSLGIHQAWDELEEPTRRDILLTDTHAPTHRVHSKDEHDLFTFYEHLMKGRHTYAWHGFDLEDGYDALYLNSPTQSFSQEDLAVIDSYLARGRTVVWLGSRASLSSAAGRQLLGHWGLRASARPRKDAGKDRVYEVEGASFLTAGASSWRVPHEIGDVRLEGEGVEVLVRLVRGKRSIDFVAAKDVGEGRLVLVPQGELFGNRNLRKEAYRDGGTALSMALAEWTVR